MKKIFPKILILLSSVTFGQNFFSPKTFKNYKYISKHDTLIIVDTLSGKTSTKYIQYFRYIYTINQYGVITARVSDAFMLLDYQGKTLSGPFSHNTFKELGYGYVLTGPDFLNPQNKSNIIFSPKGDTVLVTEAFFPHFSDTTRIPGYNPKTKRKEVGVITKQGWLTKEYVDKNGKWTK